jgi:ubiquinone/menaquinone biosynthesis C-methylase UbiE
LPSVAENLEKWNETYDWDLSETQWSSWWGGVAAQWYGSIYPRVRPFLPATSILEIAPGFGRWTQFLLQNCETYVGVDLSPKCAEACSRRFARYKGASFHSNDGHSLPMVADNSVDMAYSYDSLVHAEADSLTGYLEELARCLKDEGVAFIHHSNFGNYTATKEFLAPIQDSMDRLPGPAKKWLYRTGVYRGYHWRSPNVTAEMFSDLCEQVGLTCAGQELINWAGSYILLDAISIVTRPGSKWDKPNRVAKNRFFRLEARSIRRYAHIYET